MVSPLNKKKNLEPALTKSLTLLINQVLKTGIFPDKLKIAKVIPVYQKVRKQFSVIIGPYHLYQLFLKYLKQLFFYNYHLI